MVDEIERELGKISDNYHASGVVIHAGTNDLATKGSEEIASSLVKLAQHIKGRSRIQRYICSVTPRKDLESFTDMHI